MMAPAKKTPIVVPNNIMASSSLSLYQEEETEDPPPPAVADGESGVVAGEAQELRVGRTVNNNNNNKSPVTDAKSASSRPRKRRRTTSSTAAATTTTNNSNKGKNTKRTNWAVGEAKRQLEQAVHEWDTQQGRALQKDGTTPLSLREFSATVGIPYNTFCKYVIAADGKRRIIGNSTGRQPLLSKADQAWIAQELATRKRGERLLTHEAVDFIVERFPQLTRAQALGHFNRTLLKHQRDSLQGLEKRVYQKRTQPQQQQQPPMPPLPGRKEGTGHRSNKRASTSGGTSPATLILDHLPEDASDERKHALDGVNEKIARLRSQLLDAELEKERILRAIGFEEEKDTSDGDADDDAIGAV